MATGSLAPWSNETARRGEVLAAGGFSRNQEMRDEHQRHPITTIGAPEALLTQGSASRWASLPARWST
jgi:hypothetical protein